MGKDQDKIGIWFGAANLTAKRTIPVGPMQVPTGYLRLTQGNRMFIHILCKTRLINGIA
jgi:hypothetical protein